MVIGFIYTGVNGNADQRQELARVKRSLSIGANFAGKTNFKDRSISRTRVRTPANPKGLFGKNGTVSLGDRSCSENRILSVLKRSFVWDNGTVPSQPNRA